MQHEKLWRSSTYISKYIILNHFFCVDPWVMVGSTWNFAMVFLWFVLEYLRFPSQNINLLCLGLFARISFLFAHTVSVLLDANPWAEDSWLLPGLENWFTFTSTFVMSNCCNMLHFTFLDKSKEKIYFLALTSCFG